jgi:hypothetical protein
MPSRAMITARTSKTYDEAEDWVLHQRPPEYVDLLVESLLDRLDTCAAAGTDRDEPLAALSAECADEEWDE